MDKNACSLSSILSYQLREHYHLVYGINSESNIYNHKGYFSIYTNTEKYESVKLIVDTIINALDDLKQYKIQDLKTKTYNNIDEELLNSNKLKIENGLLALQLSHSSLGSYMTRQFFLYKNRQKKQINNFPEHLQIKNVIKTYNSITKQNIIDVCKRTFIPENLCISTISSQKIPNYFS